FAIRFRLVCGALGVGAVAPILCRTRTGGAATSRSTSLPEQFHQHTFDNGLTLLVEKMPGMQSAAMTLLLSAGSSTDHAGGRGTATVLAELVLRGAGDRDNRQLTEYLDGLGLQRSSGVGVYHTHFGAAAPAARVIEGLGAYADIVRRPMLPEVGFTAAKE